MATEEQLLIGQAQARENATVNVSLTPVEQPKFTNLKLQRDIILNDFIFNTIDDFGVVWVITDIEGWWTPPTPDIPDIPRGYGDGSYDVQGRYLARSVVLKGVFLTPDPSMVESARDRLTAAVNLVYTGAWLLTGSNPIRASFVRTVGQPKFQTVNARGRTEFEVELRAPDPIKYSWNDAQPDGYDMVEVSGFNYNIPGSGSGVVENVGNYRVPCILEVSGPVVGPATIYNKTTDELIIVVESFGGSLSAQVENKQLTFDDTTLLDIATLTTRAPHGFTAGSNIYVSGVGDPFDGAYTIESVPTETTITYARLPEVAIIRQITYKSLQANVATLETITNHGLSVGQTILVSGVDTVFDGSHTITAIPAPDKISFNTSRVPVAVVTGRRLTSNVATLTTGAPHGFLVGEQVTVAGVDEVNFNGTYEISSVSSDGLQFSYAKNRTNSKDIASCQISNLTATITTASPHGFVAGEGVIIENLGDAYNGTHTIVSTPTDSTFTYRVIRSTESSVSVKAAIRFEDGSAIATLTTAGNHSVIVGDQIKVEDVDALLNGTKTVTEVASTTAVSYSQTGLSSSIIPTNVAAGRLSISGRWIIRKNLIGNVATLTTINNHGILVGESVTVSGMGAPFDGTYTVTAVTANTFSYTKSSVNILDSSTASALATIRRESNVATLTSKTAHGLATNDFVLIGNVTDPSFNGYHKVTVVDSTTFTYPSVGSNVIPPPPTNLDQPFPVVEAGEGSFVTKSKVTMSGNVASQNSTTGVASAAGSLPFSAANGTATVSPNVGRTLANTGVVVKKNDIQFTPGVIGGVVAIDADILEINTQDREVAYNGELVGARAKIDVLADFIKLAPGENIIEFRDNGNPESEALLKVYYRSGWLS